MKKLMFILLLITLASFGLALDTANIKLNLLPNNSSNDVSFYGGVGGIGNNTNYGIEFTSISGQYIDTGITTSGSETFSISGWFNASSIGTGIFTARDTSNGDNGLRLYISGDGNLYLQATTSNSNNALISTPVNLNQINHFVVTYNSSSTGTLKLYLNDNLAGTDTTAAYSTATRELLIGRTYTDSTGTEFDGNISNFLYYSDVLNDTEINSIYQAGKNSPIDTNATFYLSANQLTDLSSNGNNAKAYGGVNSTNNNSFSSDGVDDYLNIDGSISQNPQTLSFVTWFKRDSSATNGVVFGHRDSGTELIQLLYNTNTELKLQLRSSTSSLIEITKSGETLTNWNSVGFSFDRNTDQYILYLNGVQIGNYTTPISGTFNSLKQTLFASYGGSYGSYEEGELTNAILTETILTSQDFLDYHNNGRTYEYFPKVEPTPVIEYPYEAIDSLSQNGTVSIFSTNYETVLSGNFFLEQTDTVYATATMNIQYFSNTQPTVDCIVTLDDVDYNSSQSQTPIYTQAYGALYLSSDQLDLSQGSHNIALKCRGDQAIQFDVLNSNIQLHGLINSNDYNFTSGFENLNSTLNYPTLSYNDFAYFLTSDINLTNTNYTRYVILESAAQLTYSGSQTIRGQVSFAPASNVTDKFYCPIFSRYGGNNKIGNAGYYCVYENVSDNLLINVSNYFEAVGQLGGKSHLKELILRDYEFNQSFISQSNLDATEWTDLETHKITVDSSDKDIYSVSMISFEALDNQIVGEFRFILNNQTNGTKLYRTVQNVNEPGVVGLQGLFNNVTVGTYNVTLQYKTSPGYFGLTSNISILNSTFVTYAAGESDITPNSFEITARDNIFNTLVQSFTASNGLTLSTTSGVIVYPQQSDLINLTFTADRYFEANEFNHNTTQDLEFTVTPYSWLNITAESKIDSSSISNFTISCQNYSESTANGDNLLYQVEENITNEEITCYFSHPDYADTEFNVTTNISSIASYNVEAYTTNSVTFNFRDEDTDDLITANVSIQLIGDTLTYQGSTTTGSIYFDLIAPDSYTVRYQAPGYDQNFFAFTMVNKSNSNITLYLSNSTNTQEVTALVIDENSRAVEGARIKTFVEDPNNPSNYILSQLCDTNFEGNCVLNLYLGDRAYYFVIEYPTGETKKITNPTYIYDTDISFQIVVGELAGDEFDKYRDTYVSLTHTDKSNSTEPYFSFTWNDGTNLATKGCVRIYEESITETTFLGESCINGISGTVNRSYTANNGSTYKAQAVIYYTGTSQVWDTTYKNYPLKENDPGNNGALLVVIVLLFFGMLLATKPSLLLLFAPLPITLARWLGLINLNTGVIIGLHLVFAMLAYLVSDRG